MKFSGSLRNSLTRSDELRETWFVSFPKSGRTWLRVMLDQLGFSLVYTHDGAAVKAARHMDRQQVAGPEFLSRRVVFLTRDPRDTTVSCYFQASKRTGTYLGDMADFIRDPHLGVEKVVRYNLAWLNKGPSSTRAFLPISYEQTHRDPVATLEVVARFLGRDVSLDSLRRTAGDNQFQLMQQRERSGAYEDDYGDRLIPVDRDDTESYKVRRGKVGGHKDYFTKGDIDYCREILERYRYFEVLEASLALKRKPA
jgi:hypothetical protein